MAPTILNLLSSLPDIIPRAAEQQQQQQQQQANSIPQLIASRSLPSPPTRASLLFSRQIQTSTIPSFYGGLERNGLEPGAVAGIVLGSVAGFCLLLYLLYACINMGNSSDFTESASVVTRSTAHAHAKRHSHSRRRSRGGEEVVEVRRTTSTTQRGPMIVEQVGGGERIVVEEQRRSRGPPPMRRGPVPMRSDVTSDVTTDDDEVVVIEEHSRSPPRRRSRIRSVERRSSGYREVDPDRFAGGDASVIEVRRSSSHRR
ncbi:hypothetical protein QBC35DRAFT_4363 [Podospora australis]|uniref:Uncharacterized protein n=1 Tax=Podospora australis TaxID=1536484 RepID=A0AAN6X7W6_9PEZI|nr:hypothetical protein QBC35DRAFT_4363 [Podospora australis]